MFTQTFAQADDQAHIKSSVQNVAITFLSQLDIPNAQRANRRIARPLAFALNKMRAFKTFMPRMRSCEVFGRV